MDNLEYLVNIELVVHKDFVYKLVEVVVMGYIEPVELVELEVGIDLKQLIGHRDWFKLVVNMDY